MLAEKEFAYASYKAVHQPQYDNSNNKENCVEKQQKSVKGDENNTLRTNPDASREKLSIIEEIFSSEEFYLNHIGLVDEEFRKKLLKIRTVTEKQVKSLLGDIATVYATNTILLECFRTMPIADAFLKLLPFLKLYSSYASKYPTSLKVYADLIRKDEFRNSLTDLEKTLNGQKLNSILIMPVQRVPRYIMLIEKLMLHSTDPKEMHDLHRVVSEVRKLSENMQICMETYYNGDRLLEIQELFGLTKHIFEPGRVLLKEDVLYKKEHVGATLFQERVFFLFNDVILYGKKKLTLGGLSKTRYEPSAMLSLRHSTAEYSQTDGTIFLKCGEVRILVTADKFETVKDWYDWIDEGICRARLLRKTLRKESFNKVLVFDMNFWQRKKKTIQSIIIPEVSNTIERVFSKRRPQAKLSETEFLRVSSQSRKRRNQNEISGEDQSDCKKIATLDVVEARKFEHQSIVEHSFNADANQEENNLEVQEGVDEEDRRPRTSGAVRENLPIQQIKKLSYQQRFERLTASFSTVNNDFEDDSMDFEEPPKNEKKIPWWVVEGVPPAIQNQKPSFFKAATSRCSIM